MPRGTPDGEPPRPSLSTSVTEAEAEIPSPLRQGFSSTSYHIANPTNQPEDLGHFNTTAGPSVASSNRSEEPTILRSQIRRLLQACSEVKQRHLRLADPSELIQAQFTEFVTTVKALENVSAQPSQAARVSRFVEHFSVSEPELPSTSSLTKPRKKLRKRKPKKSKDVKPRCPHLAPQTLSGSISPVTELPEPAYASLYPQFPKDLAQVTSNPGLKLQDNTIPSTPRLAEHENHSSPYSGSSSPYSQQEAPETPSAASSWATTPSLLPAPLFCRGPVQVIPVSNFLLLLPLADANDVQNQRGIEAFESAASPSQELPNKKQVDQEAATSCQGFPRADKGVQDSSIPYKGSPSTEKDIEEPVSIFENYFSRDKVDLRGGSTSKNNLRAGKAVRKTQLFRPKDPSGQITASPNKPLLTTRI